MEKEMAELERVLDGLDWCDHMTDYCCESECPYHGDYCLARLHKDAIDLLKAQEPRVMTLEELKNKIGEPIYFESHGTYMGKDGFWILPALFTPNGLMRYVHPLSSRYSELGLDCYGKIWRCWTSRPTDEQRKAVKWE